MSIGKTYATLNAEEAASLIQNGTMVAVGGFTPAGTPKAVPRALAKRGRELHRAGEAFQIRLLSGASTGAACDDELGVAEVVSWRAPYITSAPMRELANAGKLDFVDMHLSHVAQAVLEGFLGPNFMIILMISKHTFPLPIPIGRCTTVPGYSPSEQKPTDDRGRFAA
jgi:acyl-CoA hydrolase